MLRATKENLMLYKKENNAILYKIHHCNVVYYGAFYWLAKHDVAIVVAVLLYSILYKYTYTFTCLLFFMPQYNNK